MLKDVVIAGGVRTPIGRFMGALAEVPATRLGSVAARCALERAAIAADQVDEVIFGNVLNAGQGQNIARQVSLGAGLPASVGAKIVDQDEEPGRFNEEKPRALEPAFDPKRTVTAGNASSISDGAACVVVLSAENPLRLVAGPQAKILGYASASREPEWFTLAPIDAIGRLLTQLKMGTQDIGLFEINEAFAGVALSAMRDLRIPHDKLNVRGGAIALGHPIGASGARVLVTLLHAMQHEGAEVGVAALCIGGGEAVAIAVERM